MVQGKTIPPVNDAKEIFQSYHRCNKLSSETVLIFNCFASRITISGYKRVTVVHRKGIEQSPHLRMLMTGVADSCTKKITSRRKSASQAFFHI